MRFKVCICGRLAMAMALMGSAGHDALSQVIANNPPVMSQSYTLNPQATGAGPHCFEIATLPANNDGDDDHLHIVANLNYSWAAAANASIDALFGNRNGFTYTYNARGIPSSSQARLVAYMNADTSIDIYLMFTDVYATASYTVLETTEETVYSDPADLGSATPTGTLVFDSSSPSYPPATFAGFNGNVGIGTTNPQALFHVETAGTTGLANVQLLQNPSGNAGDAVGLSFKVEPGNGSFSPHLGKGALVYERTGSWGIGDFMFLQNQNIYDDNAPTLSNAVMVIKNNGSVGIGTTNPGASLEVNGSIKLTSGSGASITFPDGSVQSTAWSGTLCGGDYAESVDITGERTQYEPGDVMVVDPDHPGHFLKASERYSTAVAGIYSTKPGMIGRRQTTSPKTSSTEIPMAMVGVVPTKVTAENGPIHPGDILVTSSVSGHAMRGTDRSLLAGAIVGKALGSLDSGTGVIEVLVSLQ